MDYILPLADDSFGEEEKHAMLSVIDSGNYTMGERVEEFEEAFSDWIGTSHSNQLGKICNPNLNFLQPLII